MHGVEFDGPWDLSVRVTYRLRVSDDPDYKESIEVSVSGYMLHHGHTQLTDIEVRKLARNATKFLQHTLLWIQDPKVTFTRHTPEAPSA